MDPNWIRLRTFVNWPDGLEVAAIGDTGLLRSEKVGLFSSIRCPGDLILAAYDYAKNLRDGGTTVISGFHSPVEKECLRILLRGSQPLIICPARSLANMRIPRELRPHIEKGRLLLLSPFSEKERRATSVLARERNGFVARIADKLCFIYAEPGGSVQALAAEMKVLGKTFVSCR
jgi:hypothetical protein